MSKIKSPQSIQARISITFSVRAVECESFSFTDYAEKNTNSIPFDGYSFDNRFQIGLRPQEEIIDFFLLIDFFEGIEKHRGQLLAKMHTKTSLKIHNYNEVTKSAPNGQILIPDTLIQMGNSFALNHARGMFAMKVQGTKYSNAIIPLLDPSLLLPPRNQ